VLLAYLQVLSQEELLSLAQSQLEVTRNQVERLNILNQRGAIAPFNLYDLKGQFASDETNILNITDALHQSKLSLAQLMNIPYRSDMEIEKMDIETPSIVNHDSSDIIYKTAMQHLAMVKAADLNLQSAGKQLKAVRGNYYPVLSLNGSMFTNYSSTAQKSIPGSILDVANGDYVVIDGNQQAVITPQQQFTFEQLGYNDQFRNNVSTSISLGLTIPIFNSFQARNRVALAKINLMQAENAAETIKIQLQQAVEKGYQDMLSAYDRQQQSTEQVNAYSESFREAQVRYNTGLITSVDYLIAKNNMDRASINAAITRYEFVFRNKILDFYEGKPLW
jgi:outer membrane protein